MAGITDSKAMNYKGIFDTCAQFKVPPAVHIIGLFSHNLTQIVFVNIVYLL